MPSTAFDIVTIPFADALLDETVLLPGFREADPVELARGRNEFNAVELTTSSAEMDDGLLPTSIETLEDEGDRPTRSVPAADVITDASMAAAEGEEARVLKVTITRDENDGSAERGRGLSLRDAVLMANSTPEDEIIELESGRTYSLSIEGKDPGGIFDERDPSLLGDLDVASTGGTLTIRTTGEAKATIDANQIHRIIQVRDDFRDNAATLIVENLILTGGRAVEDDTLDDGGGAILVDEDARLEISDSIITGNDAGNSFIPEGGGIANKGIAIIARTAFTNNSAGDGGGLFSSYAVTTVTDSTFENNTASRPSSNSNLGSGGGAIQSGPGLLEIIDSTFTDNSAGFRGGGIAGVDNLASKGTLIVTNSSITNNTGSSGAGVGIGGVEEAAINGSTIENNSSTGNGGGIGVISVLDTVTISNSSVSNNTAAASGGGLNLSGTITIRNAEIANNSAGGDGGGINDSFATVTLDDSTIAGNTATGAGGGMKGGSITRNTTIRDNEAGGLGGGISTLSPGVILNSTISGNTSGVSGGGISVAGGPAGFYTVTIGNSTISGNVTTGNGGGIAVGGTTIVDDPDLSNRFPELDYTSEVVTVAGDVIVTNSTITNNTADSDRDREGGGGGISNALSFVLPPNADPTQETRTRFGSGKIALQNTIVAGNSDGRPAGEGAPDISGAARGNAHNLIGSLAGLTIETVTVAPEEESLGAGSDRVVFNPGLGPLQDNGGATQTHALVPGSPAIDAGDNDAILSESFPSPNGDEGTIDFDFNEDGDSEDVVPFDQRDGEFDRILNGTVDIGAFEGVDNSLDPLGPMTFESSLDLIATTIAIAGGQDSEEVSSAANALLGIPDRVQPDDVPASEAVDYGISEGVTVEDSALMLAAYSLNGFAGLDTVQLAGAAGFLLGDPDAIAPDTITSIPQPAPASANFVRVTLLEGSPLSSEISGEISLLGLDVNLLPIA